MGRFADVAGRKRALTLSVSLMCAGSFAIAITPDFASIGAWSPLLILVARMVQGLSVGGEYGASAVYLSEMASDARRGFFSSFQYVTLIAGQLIALAVLLSLQLVMSEAALESWGWRIPFAIGGVLALAVFYVRRHMVETEIFEKVAADDRDAGFINLLRRHPGQVGTVIFMTAGGTLAFYAFTTYMQKFLVNTSGFDRQTASVVMTLALFLYMLAQPLAGMLSDRVGRRPMLMGFGIGGVLLTVPVFTLLEQAASPVVAFLLVMVLLIVLSGYTSINAVVKAELFPANIRALGVALPYAMANALFGGTAEYVALLLKQQGLEASFYWYVTAMIGLSLIVYWRMPETGRNRL